MWEPAHWAWFGNRTACRSGPEMKSKVIIAALLTVGVGSSLYSYLRRGPKLAEMDGVILADISNKTGEAAFDGSLREALGVSLAQSPYLNVVSEEKVIEALRGAGEKAGSSFTRELGQKICERVGAK